MKHLLLALLFVASNATAENLYARTDEAGTMYLTDGPCSEKTIVAALSATAEYMEVLRVSRRWYISLSDYGKKETGLLTSEGCYLIEDNFLHWINSFLNSGSDPLNSFVKLKREFI